MTKELTHEDWYAKCNLVEALQDKVYALEAKCQALLAIAQPEQRPEFIHSEMGDLVFDGDDGYDEMLESQSLAQPEQLEGDAKDAERLAILKAIGDAGLILIKTHLGFELIKKELVIAQTDKHARSEWLQESSYRAGAKAGYNLGVGENVEGLSRLLEAHSYPENRAAIASQKATQ